MPAMLRTAFALILALACGCAPKDPSSAPTEPADVTPEMRQMVMTRYQTVVRSQLHTPDSAEFTERPAISAQVRREPRVRWTEVIAGGEVNAENEEGTTTRYRYRLTWEQTPAGWRLREKAVTPAED